MTLGPAIPRPKLVAGAFAAVLTAAACVAFAAEPQSGTGMGPGMMMGQDGRAPMGPGMGHGMMGHGMMMGEGGMMGACPMMGAMMGPGYADAAAPSFAEGRIAFLKAELAITDAQDGVWRAYADAVRKNLAGMQGMHAKMREMMRATTPVARLDAHVAAMEDRLGTLKEMRPTLAALYDALSSKQKTTADGLLTGMGCMM